MGTNYYLHRNKCSHCGRTDEPLHIGKSSAGWHFALRVDGKIRDIEDWIVKFYVCGKISRHCDNDPIIKISIEEMLDTIFNRSNIIGWDNSARYGAMTESTFHQKNDSERGLNNLLRHRIGRHCVGHGDWPYDYIPGEFS
jgi:hypothetical protein